MFKMLPELCVNPFLEYVFLWTEELNLPQNRNLTLHSPEDIFSPQRVRFGRRSLRWKHSLCLFLQRKKEVVVLGWVSWSRWAGAGGDSREVQKSPRGTGENEELNERTESLRSEWITPGDSDVITPGLKLAACVSFRSLFTLRLDIWAPLYYSCLSVAPSLDGGVNEALCPDLREELKHRLRKACQT